MPIIYAKHVEQHILAEGAKQRTILQKTLADL